MHVLRHHRYWNRTAITYNSQLYLGRTGAAGEGGHNTIDFRGTKCHCGKSGCIETFAAGWAIAGRAQDRLVREGERGKRILELAGGNREKVSSETLAKAWEEGDLLATEILRETADILAVWFGNVVDLLEPDIIVVGGGISHLIAQWFDRIASQLPFWSVTRAAARFPLQKRNTVPIRESLAPLRCAWLARCCEEAFDSPSRLGCEKALPEGA